MSWLNGWSCFELEVIKLKREEIVEMFKELDAAWSTRNPERVASFFADDCLYEERGLGLEHRGKAEVRNYVIFTFASIPDFWMEQKRILVDGNMVSREWVCGGTAPDAPGKLWSAPGASIVELTDEGKIKRYTDYWNFATYLQQTGGLPRNASKE
jgi:steroid delta-isomerase-like uncharacterized protein